jgi:hypothetical protein
VTAHYHVAMQSRRLVRPLDPGDEARLRGLAEAFAGVPLSEATRAVEAGEVVDASGAPVAWKPVASVLPVSERLRALVSGPAYEAAVARAADRVGPLLPRVRASGGAPGAAEAARR